MIYKSLYFSLGDKVKTNTKEKGKIVGIETDKDGTISYLLYFNDGTVAYRNNVKGCWFWE